jgi:tetratricopeptide (TPR) repeat protein
VVLPWVVAAAALVVYLLTLNHWVSLVSLPQVVKTAGWTWQPNLINPIYSDLLRPAYYVVTYPFRWLPAKWIPLALNLFSAGCAASTLALLARSVALLPQDRTDEQRERERSKFSTLSIPLAWVPPVMAVVTCGLQLTFWEQSTNGTNEAFDLLLFAYGIRALLEYRIDRRESWLFRAAFVCGVGMTNNWLVIGFFPVFIAAVVWIRGLSFFNPRFLARLSLCGLAGLALYLLPPLVASLSKVEPISFWLSLKSNLLLQERILFPFNKKVLGLLSLTSLLPVFVLSIRWASYFGDSSRLGAAFATLMFHIVHALLLVACAWVAFDPPFSPRHVGGGIPLLIFYYLGALSIGYFSGYLLLIFGERTSRLRYVPWWLNLVNQAVTCLVLALLVVIPAGLIYKNLPQIRATNGTALQHYAASLAESLPKRGGVLLSDDPSHLFVIQSWLTQIGREKDFLFLDTHALEYPGYHRYLHKKYPQKWGLTAEAARNWKFSVAALVRLLLKQAEHSEIYYLHPSFGYYLEYFFQEPHGLVYQLKRYPPGLLMPPQPTPELIAENEAFWTKAAGQAFEPVLAVTVPPPPDAPKGFMTKLFQGAHIAPEQNTQVTAVGMLYSRALDYWGVEMQKSGHLERAATHFELARKLNPDNKVAQINLEFNKSLRAGRLASVQLSKSAEDQFGRSRSWEQVVGLNGPFDEPTLCYAQGSVFLKSRLCRQAAELLDRVCGFLPDNLPSRLWLAQLYVGAKLPDKALALTQEIRSDPERFTLTATNVDILLPLEASAYFAKNEPDQAEKLLKLAVAQAPSDGNVLTTITAVYMGNGRYSNALPLLDRLVELSPNDPATLLNRGIVCIQANAYDEAIRTLTHLLTLQTNNYLAMLNRAIAELRGDHLDAARKDYETLQHKFPTSHKVYYGLGEIAYRRRETNGAIPCYQAYLTNTIPDTEERKLVSARLKELKGEKP